MADETTSSSGRSSSGLAVGATCFKDLPEECVSQVLAMAHLGSPRAVAQASVVSRGFLAASRADVVWARILPRFWRHMCAGAGIPTAGLSLRDVFLRLSSGPRRAVPATLDRYPPASCNTGDGGDVNTAAAGSRQQQQQLCSTAWLDRGSGAVCRAVLARGLSVCWGDAPAYWRWRPAAGGAVPGAWSPEVAELRAVCWLDVRARVRGEWTPGRRYTVSWRLAWADTTAGFDNALVSVEVVTSDGQSVERKVLLNPPDAVHVGGGKDRRCVRRRAAGAPGWFEYDVAEFAVTAGEEEDPEEVTVWAGLWEHGYGENWKKGLVVDALLVRPSELLLVLPAPAPAPEEDDVEKGEGEEVYRSPVPTDVDARG